METSVKNPLVVRCEYCGGDVSYDIAKQRYCCAHCGAEASGAEKKAEHLKWRSIRKEAVMKGIEQVKSFSCPACGAQTIATGDSVTAQCPFCQNTMIDAKFAGNDIPEVILPFKISKEEAEAKLRAWLNMNAGSPEAKVIKANMQNFTGCYLPYHIVRGAFDSKLHIRMHSGNSNYPFRAYLSHTAVNVSNDLNNLFLDGIEPFDFDSALEFNFGYLNHQNAKVQNINGEELTARITEETSAELYKSLSKKIRTKEMSVSFNDDNSETIPALMPVYLVKCENGIAAAVNGQTGKVSVDTGKEKNVTRFWWMVPTAATLAVIVAGTLFGSWGLGFMGGLVFGIVFFIIASSRHEKELVRVIKTYPKSKEEHNDTQAEFIADFGKGPVPAKLKFFTPWRIIKTLLIVLVIIFLPVFIAAPIQLMRGLPLADIKIGYGAAWYCIPGFFTILFAGGLAKSMMYDVPLYYEILPNGRTRRRRARGQNKVSAKEMFTYTKLSLGWKQGCLVIGILLFMLIGSALAMIY